MNIAKSILNTGILLALGLPLAACQADDFPRDSGGIDGDTTDSSDPTEGDGMNDDAGLPPDPGGDSSPPSDDGADDGADDGGTSDDDGAAEVCGNGFVGFGEECDDANTDELDGCFSDCRIGPTGIDIGHEDLMELPLQGNLGGGGPSADYCPPGQVITGINGAYGSGISGGGMARVQFECGVLQLEVNEETQALQFSITEGALLPVRGGPGGGTPYAARCPEGYMVVGFGGRSSGLVDQVILRCGRWDIVDTGDSLSMGMTDAHNLGPVGGAGGNPFPDAECEPGAVVTVGNARSGAHLDAFGMSCMPISLDFD